MGISVLLVDDQPLQREGYRLLLSSQPDIELLAEAGDGAQALAHVRRVATDVVLMDIQMPRVNGIVASSRITSDARVAELKAVPRVILLAAVHLDDHLAAAASAGAFAVLYKDVAPEALLDVIRSAAAHGARS